jgi:tetratricopeptide (TPR) repeat protein
MNATPGRVSLLALAASIALLPLLQPRPGMARTAWAVGEEEVPPAACVRAFEAHAYQEAQECFAGRVAKQPGDAMALFYLGRTCFERRQPMPAIDWLQRAVARAPGRSDFHDWLGRAYGIAAQRAAVVRQLGLAVKARQEFERAVELDPANPDALEDLIEFQIQAPAFLGGSLAKARAHAAELERRDPLRGRLAVAEILRRRSPAPARPAGSAGSPAPAGSAGSTAPVGSAGPAGSTGPAGQEGPAGALAAERELRAAAVDFPGDPRPRLALAAVYEQAGRLEQAADEIEAALRLDPDSTEAHGALARVAAASGRRLARAEELLTRDLQRLPPGDDAALADCHYALGALLERQGERGQAREHYQEALRRDPGSPEARAALRRLR